ncbi:MAG: hypothetical protein LBF61_05585 [Azoarcus sp.]|nr:hypothetical protein [Azoarcus sp.]
MFASIPINHTLLAAGPTVGGQLRIALREQRCITGSPTPGAPVAIMQP